MDESVNFVIALVSIGVLLGTHKYLEYKDKSKKSVKETETEINYKYKD
jgi:hypothetical protein